MGWCTMVNVLCFCEPLETTRSTEVPFLAVPVTDWETTTPLVWSLCCWVTLPTERPACCRAATALDWVWPTTFGTVTSASCAGAVVWVEVPALASVEVAVETCCVWVGRKASACASAMKPK